MDDRRPRPAFWIAGSPHRRPARIRVRPPHPLRQARSGTNGSPKTRLAHRGHEARLETNLRVRELTPTFDALPSPSGRLSELSPNERCAFAAQLVLVTADPNQVAANL